MATPKIVKKTELRFVLFQWPGVITMYENRQKKMFDFDFFRGYLAVKNVASFARMVVK